MKKRRYAIPLVTILILAALIAADAALSLPQDFENCPSRSLPGDPRAADRIAVLTVGDYPCMRDDPVTDEEAAPGHEAPPLPRSLSPMVIASTTLYPPARNSLNSGKERRNAHAFTTCTTITPSRRAFSKARAAIFSSFFPLFSVYNPGTSYTFPIPARLPFAQETAAVTP